MKVAKDTFFIEVGSQFVFPKIGGIEFWIDTDYNPKRLATIIGKIHSTSIRITDKFIYDIKINEGDIVVVNRLVCQDRNKVSDNIFMCAYHHIYARITDTIVPLEDVLFCEPICDDDYLVGQIKMNGQVSKVKAKVCFVSNFASECGIKVNDIVYFSKDADYEMEIGSKLFYKMHVRSVIGIEREGELKTFRNKLLVKNITELGSVAGIDKIYAQSNLQTGVVIEQGNTSIEVGTSITYLNGTASVVKYKDEYYAFISEENIKYTYPMKGPVLDRVLILQDEGEGMIAGFIIPDSEKKKPHKGVVVAIGPGERNKTTGELIPMSVKIGDKVIYSEYDTTTVDIDGIDYIIIREPEIKYIL